MREKVRRLLDLVRAGRLSLEDAAPLLAALSPRLALTDPDRELLASLLAREDLGTGQVAEHLLLLRGVRDVPQPPPPPRAPAWEGRGRAVVDLPEINVPPINLEGVMSGVNSMLGRAADVIGAVEGSGPASRGADSTRAARLLRVEVESSEGDEYTANLPVGLSPHLHRLIPPHGVRALERAGLSIEALQLLLEAAPPPGELVNAEDHEGNSVRLTLK